MVAKIQSSDIESNKRLTSNPKYPERSNQSSTRLTRDAGQSSSIQQQQQQNKENIFTQTSWRMAANKCRHKITDGATVEWMYLSNVIPQFTKHKLKFVRTQIARFVHTHTNIIVVHSCLHSRYHRAGPCCTIRDKTAISIQKEWAIKIYHLNAHTNGSCGEIIFKPP